MPEEAGRRRWALTGGHAVTPAGNVREVKIGIDGGRIDNVGRAAAGPGVEVVVIGGLM